MLINIYIDIFLSISTIISIVFTLTIDVQHNLGLHTTYRQSNIGNSIIFVLMCHSRKKLTICPRAARVPQPTCTKNRRKQPGLR